MKNTMKLRATKNMIACERDARVIRSSADFHMQRGDLDMYNIFSQQCDDCRMQLLTVYNIVTGKCKGLVDYDEVIEAYHKWAEYREAIEC